MIGLLDRVGGDARPVVLVEAAAGVVVGHEVERIVDAGLIDLADEERREVPADEGPGIAVIRGQLLADRLRVDAGESEERRDDVDVARQRVDLHGLGEQLRVVHDERHADGLLVGRVPLLVHLAV